MLPEYDFSKGKRGKYAAKYARGTNIVRLEPDVAHCFPMQSRSTRRCVWLRNSRKYRPRRKRRGSGCFYFRSIVMTITDIQWTR